MSAQGRTFTLFEITIAVGVFSILALGIFAFSAQMIGGSTVVAARTELSSRTDAIHYRLSEELRQAEILYVEDDLGVDLDGDGDTDDVIRCSELGLGALVATPALRVQGAREITYRLPVDHDGDGDFLDDEGRITYGVSHPALGDLLNPNRGGDADRYAASSDFTYRLRFVAARTLSEVSLGFDLNLDGDQTDVFEVGHLERTMRLSGTPDVVEQLTPDVIYLIDGQVVADVDGDGTQDPLFLQPNLTVVRITSCLGRPVRGAGLLVRRQSSAATRNFQSN